FLLMGAVVVYIGIIVIVGTIQSRRHPAKDTKDMLIAGGQLGPIVLGGTMAATWVGGGTITGGSLAVGANYGWWPAILYMSFQSFAPLFLYVIAKKINRRGSITVSNVFNDRYGSFARNYSAFVIVIAYVGTCAYQFKAFGNALYICTGLNVTTATILGIIVIVAIAVMGGMRSVAFTDAMSAIFITFCMIAALVAVFMGNGGVSGIIERTAEGTTAFPFGNYGALGWIALTVGGTMNIIGDQNFIQRMASGKDDKALKKAIYIFVAIIFAVMFCSSTLGFALRVVFPDVSSDMLFFTYASVASPIIGCLMLGCGAALILTTSNSYLLSATTSGVMDIWCRFVDKDASETRKVWYIRVCLVIFAIIAYIMGTYFPDVLSIQNYIYALYSSAITPALFAALLWKKVTPVGAISSMMAGSIITLANEFAGQPFGLPSAILALPVSLALLYFVSKATYKGPTERDVQFFADQGDTI
ncbi:MAG: sodium:solute symporter family protein, partial [Clostridiales bacterium]|nr:sodium:solute symporter family protein [Clostridiales bacterium]